MYETITEAPRLEKMNDFWFKDKKFIKNEYKFD